MLSRIRSHIENKIAEAVLEESPFPHLIIENFFPDDIYEKLVEYNPFKRNHGEEWLAKSRSAEMSSATPYYARKQINFHKNQAFDAPEDQQAFWNEVKGCFLDDDWFPELVVKKYPAFFRLRFGDLVDDADFPELFRRELFLQRHEPGYYIGPHTYIPTRVFTCIFSFARTEGFEEFGTELLAPKDRMERCWGSDHYAPEAFELKKVAPYKPNNFLLFFKTRHSFHAVRSIDDTVPDERYGMQFQFYEPQEGLFTDLSTPDLMHVRRPKHEQASTAKRIIRKLLAPVS